MSTRGPSILRSVSWLSAIYLTRVNLYSTMIYRVHGNFHHLRLRVMISQILQLASFICGGWVIALFLDSSPFVQRHVFYARKAPIWWTQKLDHPKTSGFLPNQVFRFIIPSSNGPPLYAWLVFSLQVYPRHEASREKRLSQDLGHDLSLRLVRDNPGRRRVRHARSLRR
ncbi:hypothetical protein F5B20DRAFT_321074 [Whalleya microplaca]|nr:hypothetical protein F5B20DRAFT_321074 [Whalleya microplaca]